MAGWGWGMMMFGLIFWVALIVLAAWLVRTWSERGPAQSSTASHAATSAQELLDQRLARGEIDVDEYQHRHDALRGRASPRSATDGRARGTAS